MSKVERARFLEVFSERILQELKPLIEERDKAKEAPPRLQQALADEEIQVANLQREITALNERILEILGEAGEATKESSRLRKQKEALAESQSRIESLKTGIEARKKGLYHAEHDLLATLQEKVQALRAEIQLEIHAEMGAILDRMEGWRDALSDLCQALGIAKLVGAPYQNRQGQHVVPPYTGEDFCLDPRPPRFFEYLSSTLNEEPWHPGAEPLQKVMIGEEEG